MDLICKRSPKSLDFGVDCVRAQQLIYKTIKPVSAIKSPNKKTDNGFSIKVI